MIFLKKIFNSLFSEKTKDVIRRKLDGLFRYIDQKITFREYVKACKYILKKIIYDEKINDYSYRYDDFLNQIKREYIRKKIECEDIDIRGEEIDKCVDYVKKKGLDIYCGSLDGVCIYTEKDIGYDEENELFYGIYVGKKLYFPEIVKSAKEALEDLNGLAAEQSEHSPHRYLSSTFDVDKQDIVFDIGCADGNFALSIIDKVKEVYLFEIEDIWMKPLELTFAPYKDKVHIIKKCVTKKSDNLSTSLDDFCKENDINRVGLIKMDVEGYEQDVLQGAKKMLKEGRIDKVVACTYHRIDDAEKIGDLLPNYSKTFSEGYMVGSMLYDIWDIKPPFFTRGLVRAKLETKH